MNRFVLGAVIALVLAGVGAFWWQGRAEVEAGAPPPDPTILVEQAELPVLPQSDPRDLIGPEPPEASELTKEQKRFFRYDRNRDWRITRTEMLSSRTNAFRKLDTDGNNLLDFEEWAVTTVEKFEGADENADNLLTPGEFATTAPKPSKSRRCNC